MSSPADRTRHPVERLLMPLEPLSLTDPVHETHPAPAEAGRVRCLPTAGSAEWLAARGWRIHVAVASDGTEPGGRSIERFARATGAVVEARQTDDGRVIVPFSLAEAYRGLTLERWTANGDRLTVSSSVLDAFYRVKRLIPRVAQLAARRALIRLQGPPRFPAWPYDDSVAALLRFAIRCSLLASGRERLPFRWFWPDGAAAAAILTHDVESADGLRNALRIADLEQERELRSSFNIVGDRYPIDWGIIDELRARGFELGVHGIFHDRSLFSSRPEFERQRALLSQLAQRLKACGFRSPATHRVDSWLGDLPFEYDCTIPLSDPYEPQPGGCCSPWPFFVGDLVELPYTLPQDHTLFTLLRHSTIEVWTQQVDRLERSHGLIQCVTHPDPGYLGAPANERRYAEFLDFLAARRSLWLALPREAARWWDRRGQDGETEPAALGTAVLQDDQVDFYRPDTAPPL
jgi:hypothetical protein